MCSALRVGHRDPIEPRCSLCGDVRHDDKARGPEHYGLVRPTDTLQSDAVWLRLGQPVAFSDEPRKVKVTSVGVGSAVTSKRTNTGSAWKVTSPTSSSPRGEPVLQTCTMRFVTAHGGRFKT